VFGAELIGTALLVAVGLSIVILDFGQGSPVVRLLPGTAWRRLVTGFLFGTTGATIALSRIGKESGAHINPAVTVGFWLMGRMKLGHALGYVACQLVGAIVGAVPLLAWGAIGRSVAYGATVPGAGYGTVWALLGEAVTTFVLVFGLFFFLRHRSLKAFTPALFPPLYAIMVWLEAAVSGTSTNPARSLGPAVIANVWHGWWVYWLGPLVGTLLAVAAHRWADRRWARIEVAKIHHFDHDPYRIFHI
ncbi:MAG: aquaporin, partial [Alphaproteobacteria bacterium]|nr:aquaporin [Alphaproteobacteria bacterium]